MSFFWSSSSCGAWSRISVISSENRFDASLRSSFAEVVQLPAGAGAFGEGLREPAFLERLGGLADVLAALLDLLAGLGHPVAVLLALHPLAELVGVAEDLLLLVAEPLELPLDLLRGPAGLGGLEGRLQLLEPLVQVGLPLGQLAEAVERPAGSRACSRSRWVSCSCWDRAVRCSS